MHRQLLILHSPITTIARRICGSTVIRRNCGSTIVTRNRWRPNSGTTTFRRFLAVTATTPNCSKRHGLPFFAHTYGDSDEREERGKDESFLEAFPQHFRPGAEMDIRIVKVTPSYALCRPVSYPKFKGIMSNYELTEDMEVNFERQYDATYLVELNMIYKAIIMELKPPNRIVFSLRRVRRVLRDDFRPMTIAIFNLHPYMGELELQRLMEQSGKVLEVSLHTDQEDANQPSYVTFVHEADAMSAVRKWNKTSMPYTVDDKMYNRRVRFKKARHQIYRDRLQKYLDKQLEEKIAYWDETPAQRVIQERTDAALAEVTPWHAFQRKNDQEIYFADTLPEYTVKNNPRKP